MSNHPRSRRRMAAGLALAGIAACATASSTMNTMNATQQAARVAATVRNDGNILAVLHASNLGEITAGMLAQQRGTDSAVKAYGAMMMSEHSTLDQQGATLSREIQVVPVPPDSTLQKLIQAESDTLRRAAAGAEFDLLYMRQQIVDHQRTLALVDASIGIAQHAELKTALQSQIRPAVAAHLARAQEIQTRLGAGAPTVSKNP
jgi:putative membrane protein